MRDEIVVGALVLTFAALITAHVTLVYGLARRRPRWRAAVAFFVMPLAPYWGYLAGMRVRAGSWVVAAAAYAVLVWFAQR